MFFCHILLNAIFVMAYSINDKTVELAWTVEYIDYISAEG